MNHENTFIPNIPQFCICTHNPIELCHDGYIYSLMGISELSKFIKYQSAFLSAIRNFKELADADKLNRKPEVIRIKTVPQQMTYKQLFRISICQQADIKN